MTENKLNNENNNEKEIICYDVELGYEIKLMPLRLVGVSYNRWNGEYFEVVEEILPLCSFQYIRKRMKKNLKKLKTTDTPRMEVGFNGLWNC